MTKCEALIFFFAAYELNPLCLKLSPVALILLCGYHFVKRFHFLCHFVLGAVLAVAPIGGWLAVTGVFSWHVLPLCFAVMFWVAGFDILYSLQDVDFDRSFGLHSVPVKFGQTRALLISRYCHVATIVCLVFFGLAAGLSWVYWGGVAVCSILLTIEHHIISDGDISKLNTAFFTINGWMGILLFIFTFLDVF
jgi:4-hydroxybenzoate polyprenyltransferase